MFADMCKFVVQVCRNMCLQTCMHAAYRLHGYMWYMQCMWHVGAPMKECMCELSHMWHYADMHTRVCMHNPCVHMQKKFLFGDHTQQCSELTLGLGITPVVSCLQDKFLPTSVYVIPSSCT